MWLQSIRLVDQKKGFAEISTLVCVCGSLTICMHSDYEVISHGFGLPQLVGVTIVHHVITVETDRGDDSAISTENNRYRKRSSKPWHRAKQIQTDKHTQQQGTFKCLSEPPLQRSLDWPTVLDLLFNIILSLFYSLLRRSLKVEHIVWPLLWKHALQIKRFVSQNRDWSAF